MGNGNKGCKRQEIAEIIDTSDANAKTRIQQARRQLNKVLEAKCRFKYDEGNVLVYESAIYKNGADIT